MLKILAALVLVSALLYLWFEDPMPTCELSHSRDTCHSAIYP